MNAHELDQLRLLMEDEINRLTNEISMLEAETQPIAPDTALGRLSRMDSIRSKSMKEAELQSATAKLQSLSAALERVNEPEYGLCIKCGNEIPFQRLQLMPETELCVSCAEVSANS